MCQGQGEGWRAGAWAWGEAGPRPEAAEQERDAREAGGWGSLWSRGGEGL